MADSNTEKFTFLMRSDLLAKIRQRARVLSAELEQKITTADLVRAMLDEAASLGSTIPNEE